MPPRRPGAVRALAWTEVASNFGEDEDWEKTGDAAIATTPTIASSACFMTGLARQELGEILGDRRESSMCRKSWALEARLKPRPTATGYQLPATS